MFMRRSAAVALVVIGIALPVCAQRPSGHAGSSGHSAPAFRSAPAFHGRVAAPAANRAPSGSRGARAVTAGGRITARRPPQRPGSGGYGARAPYTGSWRYRRPYVPRYGVGVSYGVLGYGYPGWIGAGPVGYSDSTDDDQSAPPQSAGPDVPNVDDQQPDDQDLPPWPYGSQAAPGSAQPGSASGTGGEGPVTLIFKDGRPPVRIQNYILTRNTLYVGDHHPDIPVDQLDLAATIKVNQDMGVDFRLPNSTR